MDFLNDITLVNDSAVNNLRVGSGPSIPTQRGLLQFNSGTNAVESSIEVNGVVVWSPMITKQTESRNVYWVQDSDIYTIQITTENTSSFLIVDGILILDGIATIGY